MKDGFFNLKFGGKIDRHPDSGVIFDGYTVPLYHEALQLCLKAHSYFYGIHSIGWDIAISENGPVIIEGNDNWGIAMFQILYGGLKKRFLSSI